MYYTGVVKLPQSCQLMVLPCGNKRMFQGRQYLSFSRCCFRGFRSPWMRCCVVGCVVPNILRTAVPSSARALHSLSLAHKAPTVLTMLGNYTPSNTAAHPRRHESLDSTETVETGKRGQKLATAL
jgi:hypothetical protein